MNKRFKNWILKKIGVDLEMIKNYLELKQKEQDVEEFLALENKIVHMSELHHGFLSPLRVYTDSGFPVERYRQLSYKLGAEDSQKYDSIKAQEK